MATLPEEIKAAMQGVIPAHVVTCARDGTPNTTAISQVYYVGTEHVALSHQFFNKTVRNVRENPQASVVLNDLQRRERWVLGVEYDHSETDGPIFDAMNLQIEAIATATGMSGIFKLRSADLYRVKDVARVSLT
jgi:hypothetical protein